MYIFSLYQFIGDERWGTSTEELVTYPLLFKVYYYLFLYVSLPEEFTNLKDTKRS